MTGNENPRPRDQSLAASRRQAIFLLFLCGTLTLVSGACSRSAGTAVNPAAAVNPADAIRSNPKLTPEQKRDALTLLSRPPLKNANGVAVTPPR